MKKTLLILLGIGLLCGIMSMLLIVSGVLLINQKSKENTLQTVELADKYVYQFFFDTELSNLFYLSSDVVKGQINFVHYDLNSDSETILLDVTSKDPLVDYGGTIFIDNQDYVYFEQAKYYKGFAVGYITKYNLKTGDREVYNTPRVSNIEENWDIEFNNTRDEIGAEICRDFFSPGDEIKLINFNDSSHQSFYLNENTNFTILSLHCDNVDLSLEHITEILNRPKNTSVEKTERQIVDKVNDLKIDLINQSCWNSCSYDYEVNYGNDYFFTKREINLSITNDIVSSDGEIVFLSGHKLYKLEGK